MKRISSTVVVALALLALGACGGRNAVKGTTPAAPTAAASGAEANGAGDSTATGAAGGGASATAGGEGAVNPAEGRLVYFDFDSADIRSEFLPVVAAQAKRLAANASLRVRLEGHTDERGSAEYNIGLGERRAQAVRRALMLQGVAESQLTTISYGRERPAVAGSNEEAWAKNRRVEIVNLN